MENRLKKPTSTTEKETEKAQLFHFKCQEARGTGCLSLNGLRVRVRCLSDIFTKMPHLTHIYLSGCQLQGNVPTAFTHLKNLHLLDLSDNRLENFPPTALVQSQTLSVLDLSINKLTRLPQTIGTLRALRELNVAQNDLVELPSALGHLYLQTLNTSHNLLRTLPESLCDAPLCHSLRVLRIQCNVLVELPERLGLLNHLTELDVRDNNLQRLPVGAKALTKLQVLHHIGNRWPVEVVSMGRDFKQQQLESSYGANAVETLEKLVSGGSSTCTLSTASTMDSREIHSTTNSGELCSYISSEDAARDQEPLLLEDLSSRSVMGTSH